MALAMEAVRLSALVLAPRRPVARTSRRRAGTLVVHAQQRSFSVEPPEELLQRLRCSAEPFGGWEYEDEPDMEEAAAAARVLQDWLQARHAELARVAGEVEEFTAGSWELHRLYAIEATAHLTLALEDVIGLLRPERLAAVTLRLDDGEEPLPGGALRALRPFRRLRALRVTTATLGVPEYDLNTPWSWKNLDYKELEEMEEEGAEALAGLAQLRQLAIVKERVSEAAVAACAQLTALTSLELAAAGKRASLRGTASLTSLPALQDLDLASYDQDAQHPFPPPTAFPALRSPTYEILGFGGAPSLLVTRPTSGNGAGSPAAWAEVGAADCSFCGEALRLGGIEVMSCVGMRGLLDALLPPGAELTTLCLAAGFYGDIDGMDWACERLRSVTRLHVDGCSDGSLPALLAQLPSLTSLALEGCMHIDDDEPANRAVDGARLLPALAPLARLTRLSLARTHLTHLQAFPPLPGLEHLALTFDAFRDLAAMDPSPLAACAGLRSLRLGGYSMGRYAPGEGEGEARPDHFTPAGVAAVAAVLPSLPFLSLLEVEERRERQWFRSDAGEAEEGERQAHAQAATAAAVAALRRAAPGLKIRVV